MPYAPSYNRANRFGPSRSCVAAKNGVVAASQPVAALAGIDILRAGGNAVDAAVAAAAALCVAEPMSTGIGGDAFALIYDAETNQVYGLNASGRAPEAATLDEYERRLGKGAEIGPRSALAVTVPGAAAGWADAAARFGRMPLSELMKPAVRLAEDGFALTPQIANAWRGSEGLLRSDADSAPTWLMDGRAPRVGQIFLNPNLARTLRLFGEGGTEAFYGGEVGAAIVHAAQKRGSLLAKADLESHTSTWTEPIQTGYRGAQILEMPPNGQGIAALETLNILALEDAQAMGFQSPDLLHLQIEAFKLAFHDRNRYVTDPEFEEIPVESLLSESYARSQRKRISMKRANQKPTHGEPRMSDTVYLCAADSDGNMVSFINSLYMGWGCGVTAGETGVLLQNRGASFSLDPSHVNRIAPRKRTRHTIIPAMLMENGKPLAAFGVMGGDMQAQGHVQVASNMLDFMLNPQDAIDAPRWRYNGHGAGVSFDPWTPTELIEALAKRGHAVAGTDGFFGGAQTIYLDKESGAYHAGSDPRRDGAAIGY